MTDLKKYLIMVISLDEKEDLACGDHTLSSAIFSTVVTSNRKDGDLENEIMKTGPKPILTDLINQNFDANVLKQFPTSTLNILDTYTGPTTSDSSANFKPGETVEP